MPDPNDYPCECGEILTSESCFCPKCKIWLCDHCGLRYECDERQD